MSPSFLLFEDAVISGVLLGLSTCGLVVSLKLLNFPDLSIDGAFALGGAVTALALRSGAPPVACTLFATCAGAVSGLCVATLHCYLGIGKLMAGILMLGVLYSAALLMMGGANAGLIQFPSVFDLLEDFAGGPCGFLAPWGKMTVAVFPLAACLLILFWLLHTRLGVILRACGSNREALRACGIAPRPFEMCGMAIAGSLPALAGSLSAQNRGGADVSMGVGLILTALAAFLIGRALIKSALWLSRALFKTGNNLRMFDYYFSHAAAARLLFLSALTGAFVYQGILLLAIRWGLWGGGVRFMTAALIIVLLVVFRESVVRKEEGLL